MRTLNKNRGEFTARAPVNWGAALLPSEPMKALVLGSGGQLGSELAGLLPDAIALTRADLSVTDSAAVEAAVREHSPGVVFNCAAYNAVDQAESEPDHAYAVNAAGATNIAAACARHGAFLVHFSTNFVFDGALDRPYLESDSPAPLGVYAKSKLAGEAGVLAAYPAALLIRTAALFGAHGSAIKGGSFPDRILARSAQGLPVRVVSDQLVNPTYAADLARAAVELARSATTGLVHVVAEGCCAWDEFARAVLAECGLETAVEPVPSSAFHSAARRPLNGCLASERVASLRPWRDGLHDWAAARAGV
jgi:dTDP-4-dehydrorhamnose reductase